MSKENNKFGEVYAKYYDTIYHDKDYLGECDLIEQIFRLHKLTVKDILDVGCGTGGHLIPLTERGYHVIGVDLSDEMLKILRQKISPHIHERIYTSKIQDLDINTTFDAIISMFGVLNYITDTNELLQTLKKIHEYLNPGGLFIFDIWYGPAVTSIRPTPRLTTMTEGDITVERKVTPELDQFNQTVRLHYTLQALKDNKIIDDVAETHTMRYFFPQEIIYFLQNTGFEILNFSEFMELDKPPSIDVWNTMIVVRRK